MMKFALSDLVTVGSPIELPPQDDQIITLFAIMGIVLIWIAVLVA